MKRRRSRRGLVVEISADDDGTLSARMANATMPRPALPYAQRPWRCALGRHRYMTVWDRADAAPGWWPAIAVVRCVRCGVARPHHSRGTE